MSGVVLLDMLALILWLQRKVHVIYLTASSDVTQGRDCIVGNVVDRFYMQNKKR